MATYTLIRPKRNALITIDFPTYNEAVAFMHKSGVLNPSKPYKKLAFTNSGKLVPVWRVSMPNGSAANAEYRRTA